MLNKELYEKMKSQIKLEQIRKQLMADENSYGTKILILSKIQNHLTN